MDSHTLLTDTVRILVRFNGLDPSIQVVSALGFLFVARRHDSPNLPTTRDMANELNLTSTMASRITYYWADKGYLTVAMDPAKPKV